MTRKIKASEVREGMEIEWSDRGWYHRGVVAAVTRNHPRGVWVQSSDGFEMSVEPDEVFTVLAEPQPPEPTAFGAAVEAGGVWFVRLDVRDLNDPDFQPWQSESLIQCTWAEVCDQGQVTVVNPDPFASTEQREPRVWDRWADVPDRVTVRLTDVETPYRKVGDRIECKPVNAWEPSLTGERGLNIWSPFTEARDA